MTWLDGTIVIILIGSTLYSIIRGLIKEFFSLFSLVVGFSAANKFHPIFIKLAATLFDVRIPGWIAFIILFFATWLLVTCIGKITNKILSISVTLKVVDKIGGGGIGLTKGIIIIAVVIIPLSSFNFGRDILKDSFTAKYIISGYRAVTSSSNNLIPDYEAAFKKIQKKIGNAGSLTGKISGKSVLKAFDSISEKDRSKLEKLLKEALQKKD